MTINARIYGAVAALALAIGTQTAQAQSQQPARDQVAPPPKSDYAGLPTSPAASGNLLVGQVGDMTSASLARCRHYFGCVPLQAPPRTPNTESVH